MVLKTLKEYLGKELNKFTQKSSTSMSDQELICKILCNYGMVQELENIGLDTQRSSHSMRDREIASLEEKIDNAPSDYEKNFYKMLIRTAQDYKG